MIQYNELLMYFHRFIRIQFFKVVDTEVNADNTHELGGKNDTTAVKIYRYRSGMRYHQ